MVIFVPKISDTADHTAHADNPESSLSDSEDWTVYMQSRAGQTGSVMCSLAMLNVVLKITGRKGVYYLSTIRRKSLAEFTKAFDTSYFPFTVTNGNISSKEKHDLARVSSKTLKQLMQTSVNMHDGD